MRSRCTAYVLLVALAACGSSSAATSTAAGPTGSCGPAKATSLASSRSARVYGLNGNVYGCAFGHRRSYLLGASARSIREDRASSIAVAGPYAGYATTMYGVDTVSSAVVVRDLRTGRQLRALPASTALLPESIQIVESLVLKSDGAVAWISQASSIISHGYAQLEVQRADAEGHAVLDSGSSIRSRSLRLRGSTLTWRHGRTLRSASLR